MISQHDRSCDIAHETNLDLEVRLRGSLTESPTLKLWQSCVSHSVSDDWWGWSWEFNTTVNTLTDWLSQWREWVRHWLTHSLSLSDWVSHWVTRSLLTASIHNWLFIYPYLNCNTEAYIIDDNWLVGYNIVVHRTASQSTKSKCNFPTRSNQLK